MISPRIIADHVVFEVPDGAVVQGLLGLKTAGNYVAVPHDLATVRFFANQGVKIPNPIETKYNWPGRFKPYKHQTETVKFLTLNRRAYILSGMGCIAGDAIVSTNRRGCTRKYTLREIYKKWTHPQGMGRSVWTCRSLRGDRFGLNGIENVVFRGFQPTLKFTLADGKTLRCTSDHVLAQPGGVWKSAGEMVVGDFLVTNGKKVYPRVLVPCPVCGVSREVGYGAQYKARRVQCRACKWTAAKGVPTGEASGTWEGGKPFIDRDGYVRVYLPGHPRADQHNRVYEHIVVAERAFGIRIEPGEMHVHHKNRIKHDNRPENLAVLEPKTHYRSHETFSHLDGSRTINGGVLVVLPKTSRIVSIEDGGIVDVYDICMQAPHHNFVANGVVVHNSGKTKAALWALDYLMKAGEIQKAVIFAPLSTLERVWAQEVFETLPHRRAHVLHGAREKRFALLADKSADIYITNHDAGGILHDALKDRPDIDHVILDELAAWRTMTTHRARTMFSIVNRQGVERSCWGLTGTPTPTAPTDCYGQLRIVTPERYKGSFKAIQNELMYQVSQFRWVPRTGSANRVHELMQPSIRYALEDCIDLPETIWSERECELSPEQAKAYKEMKDTAVMDVRGEQVTAVNAAVLLGKLVQCACGCVYDGDGNVLELDFGPRLSVLEETIEASDAKVIVFVPLTGVLNALYDKLKKKWSVAVVDGGVSAGKRNDIFLRFQTESDPHVILAHPGTMAHGLTLTAATTICWYAPITSSEYFLQANARIARPGQTKVTNIVMIQGSPAERGLYRTLKERGRMQDLLLSLTRGGV